MHLHGAAETASLCRPRLSVLTAILLFAQYQGKYGAKGVLNGSGQGFDAYLATEDGQAELRKLQARAERFRQQPDKL